MNRKFRSVDEKTWLQNKNNELKQNTYELGVKAINSLLKDGAVISYRSISNRSKEVDKSGKGIHPNTIKNNKALYEHYLNNCTAKPKKKPTRSKMKIGEFDFKNIKIDRDVDRVKHRYLQLTKIELVELLINAEQFIAEQNQIWIKSTFQSFR